MKDILEEIIADKRDEVAAAKEKRQSMKRALEESTTGIIAEFKRKSPSKGWIHADARVEDVVPLYAEGGASAVSVLTNSKYFGGSADFVVQARRLAPDMPILRKEFIIDPYQVYESKAIGADAVLLIAAALTPSLYGSLLTAAHSVGLEVLLEVHESAELAYLHHGVPDMLGVNNRSLGTFHTDVQHSFDIAAEMCAAVADIPEEERPLLVSESGIDSVDMVRRLRRVGFRGFLIGERFMREPDPGEALADFCRQLTPRRIKVCGMRDADNIRDVESLGVDLMGFVFYDGSKRNVTDVPAYLPSRCRRVGVFVNADIPYIIYRAREFGLNYVQLHGDETAEYITALRHAFADAGLIGVKIIRAVTIGSEDDVRRARMWDGCADMLLFETPSANYGGSGKAFNWTLLSGYNGRTPFLLAGGIGSESLDALRSFSHSKWVGVDLNSKFETAPGLKDTVRLRHFVERLRTGEPFAVLPTETTSDNINDKEQRQ